MPFVLFGSKSVVVCVCAVFLQLLVVFFSFSPSPDVCYTVFFLFVCTLADTKSVVIGFFDVWCCLLIAVAFVRRSGEVKKKNGKICFALHVHTLRRMVRKNASTSTILRHSFTLADINAVIVAIVIITSIRVASAIRCLPAMISKCSLFFQFSFISLSISFFFRWLERKTTIIPFFPSWFMNFQCEPNKTRWIRELIGCKQMIAHEK